MKFRRKPRENVEINLASLIDVVFILLLFFVKSDLESLMAALQKESEGDNSLPLIISADAKAQHQAVITAMDAAGKLGFAHLRMTTIEAQAAP